MRGVWELLKHLLLCNDGNNMPSQTSKPSPSIAIADGSLSRDDGKTNAAATDKECYSAPGDDDDDTASIDGIDGIVERLAGECEYVDFVRLLDFLGNLRS